MAKKVLDIIAILSAQDKMSRTINKAFDSAQTRMTNFQKSADKMAGRANAFGRNTGGIAAVTVAPLAMSTNEAIKFEDQMADVAKVLNMKVGSDSLNAVGNDVRALSVTLARTPDQVAGLYASLAQGGVAQKDLNRIAENAGKVGVAFDIATDVAGERFIKIKNAMGITIGETERLMDSVNFLSDNTAAKAPQILDFFSAGGAGATKLLKVTPQVGAAMGSFFISMGKSGSEAATIIERFSKGMLNANSSAGKIFSSKGGGFAGLQAVLEKGRSLKGSAQFEFFNQFGQYGTEIMQMANNYDQFQNIVSLANDETAQAGSVNAEFANRMSTTATQMRQVKIELLDLSLQMGSAFLPVIKKTLTQVRPYITNLKAWIEANPKLTGQITKTVAVVGGFLGLMSGAGFILGGAAKAVSVGVTVFKMMATAIKFVTIATRVLSIAMMTNPIIAIITGIAIGAFLIIKNWSKIKVWFVNMWAGVKEAFTKAWEWIKGIQQKMFEAGANIMKSIWKGIKAYFSFPLKAIKMLVQKIRDHLPFSPAKIGPLRDINKIKISETIAATITPKPINTAMTGALQPVVGTTGSGSNYGGGGVNINFSPTINIAGPATEENKAEFMDMLRKYSREFVQMMKEEMNIQDRLNY
jgi:TP901 family phage tail tape measure protein